MSYYIRQPQLWAPQEYAAVLAVLIPPQHQSVPSQVVYFNLLKKRLNWLIQQRQLDSSLSLLDTHEFLRQSLSLLNPLTLTQPTPPHSTASSHHAWRQAWANAIVEESGIIHGLLASTQTQFPQPVLSVGRRATLLRLFETPTTYCLKHWLGELVYLQTQR